MNADSNSLSVPPSDSVPRLSVIVTSCNRLQIIARMMASISAQDLLPWISTR